MHGMDNCKITDLFFFVFLTVNGTGYVAEHSQSNKSVAVEYFCNKKRLDDDDNPDSHLATEGDGSGQPSDVRNIALQNIVATAIYVCPLAIPEGVP
jgi:hypothetical protein